jgi:N-methylhydantoinase B/oxoprolinase/acetone carboxylase alpha subunit
MDGTTADDIGICIVQQLYPYTIVGGTACGYNHQAIETDMISSVQFNGGPFQRINGGMGNRCSITIESNGIGGRSAADARGSDGRWRIFYETHPGGEGASGHRDGGSATRVHMSNVMNTPVEVIEGEYPIAVEEHALRPGSGGDGRHRGGLGIRRAYRLLADGVTLTTMLDRCIVPPWGAFGGREGLPFRVTVNPGPGERVVGGKETLTLARGDLVLLETCGGGGYGPPSERPPELRERDRGEGYV